MVSRAAPALTKLDFRRDVRLFLSVLVGVLITLILALVILLGYAAGEIAGASEESARTKTRAAAALIESSQQTSPTLASYLIFLRSELDIDAIEFVAKDGTHVSSGDGAGLFRVEHRVSRGTVVGYFNFSDVTSTRRTFILTTILCAAATIAGVILLFLYLPRITAPVEALLDEANLIAERHAHQDEAQYLVETFQNTVSALRARERELERLHAAQKSRADDLERVTSALTRSLTSGFVAIDPDERIVDANAAAREILQVAARDVAGLALDEAFGATEFTDTLQRAVRQRTTVSRAEITLGEQTIGLTTVPLLGESRGDAQPYLGTIALFTDLTPIRRLEELLRESQNLADLGEISAGIAHEFRNSLSTILGYLRLARRGSGVPPGALSSIEKAEREASTLAEAVAALLAFARPMSIERHPVDLYEVACDVAERVATDDVPVSCTGESVTIEGDAALLRTAIENLVRNAIDAVREKGSGDVAVTITRTPTPAIHVRDTGAGIDPADVAKLLLPFQSRKAHGHGLGLPLAKKIAFLHGGTLRLTGAPGEGATATIEFVSLDAHDVAAGTFRTNFG
ncbi:MAG TPA: ATP-binding protein [Thermoanaerobaculia bacterium]